jgi:endo-alpha-1,4-polygalactosaminidase (GH114 family)
MDDGEEPTPEDDDTATERMEEYERLAEQERECRSEKRSVLSGVGEELADAVERAIEATGANVAVESVSNDGTRQTLTARLDHAPLVAAVTEELPPGFTIKRITEDGELAVEWSRREKSPEQRATAILQAIVREQLETDAEEFITSAPSRESVIERAAELGVPETLAGDRLQRLEDVGMVSIEQGKVFPDSEF